MSQLHGLYVSGNYEIFTGSGTLTSVGATVTCSTSHFIGLAETIIVASKGYTVVDRVSDTVMELDRAPSSAWASVSWEHRRCGSYVSESLDTDYNQLLVFSDEEVKIKGGTLEILADTSADVTAGSVSISSDSATGSVDISAENDVDITGDAIEIVAESSGIITGGTALHVGTTGHTMAQTIDSFGYIRKEKSEASMFNVTGKTLNNTTMNTLPVASSASVVYDPCGLLITGSVPNSFKPKTSAVYKIDYHILINPNTVPSGMEVVALVRQGSTAPTYASFDSKYGTKLYYLPLASNAVIDLRLSWISPLVGGDSYNFWIWHNAGKALTLYSGSTTMDCNIRFTKVCG